MFQTNIIARETKSTMVESYHRGCSKIDQAYELLNSGSNDYESALGTQILFVTQIPSACDGRSL